MIEPGFSRRVNELVRMIPRGRVMTYGQLASLAGNAKASRIVGGIAHFGDPTLPWHRVVNKKGGLASGYPGGKEGHKKDLEAEGIKVEGTHEDYFVDVTHLLWSPVNEHRAVNPRIVYIVGPTASGKTSLAIEVAKAIGAEIICADSQTLRKELTIGTAKPTHVEMAGVPHHMVDIIEPYEQYSIARFIKDASACMRDILSRGKSVLVVGGSGMYIDSLYYRYQLPSSSGNLDNLDSLSLDELRDRIEESGLELPKNSLNKRHLIGVLRRNGLSGSQLGPEEGSMIIGLNPGREVIKEKIAKRIELMFSNGFIDEVKHIVSTYGPPPKDFDAIGYKIAYRYLQGEITLEHAKELFEIGDRQYAKRQMTWFKRNKAIVWFDAPEKAKTYILEGT